ncbi:hypothetical protein CTA2_507 [Colletotrichum tanaceti]|nr:hypothetical protein CTA2_507 [Colletotrichum tanaceti]
MKSGTAGSSFFSGSGFDSTPVDSGSGSSNTGAIAGGVVGGVLGVALVGLAAFCLMRRRKHKKLPTEETGAAAAVEAPAHPHGMEQAYSPNPPPSTTMAPSELHGEYRDHSPYSASEVPKTMRPPEMDAQGPRHFYAAELDGSEARR